jgi:hypothetical protein
MGPLGAVLLVKARLNRANPAVATPISSVRPAIKMFLVDMEWFYPFGFVFHEWRHGREEMFRTGLRVIQNWLRNAEYWMRRKTFVLRQICAAPKSNLNNGRVSFQPVKRVTIWKWLEQFWW